MRNLWIKIFIPCLIIGLMSWSGARTPLQAEPASPPQPSAPAPASTQPPTPSRVQPSKTPASKPIPPPQLQPSPTPSTPASPPGPGYVPPPTRRRGAPPPIAQPSTPTAQPLSVPAAAEPAPSSAAPAPATTSPETPAAAPPAQPVRPVPPRMGSGVVFNFDNADIYEVIRVMAEVLRISYIIDPRVKGVVNIHTSGQISAENTFPIFQSILRLNGATAVKKDGVYEIVPLADAKKLPQPTSTIRESGKPPSEERYTIQIVSLKYIPATEVSKMIKPFLSDGADIVEHPPSNTVIIGDLASNVKKALDIINLFDLDIFADLRVRVYPILNADVNEVAKEMDKIFTSFEVSTKSGRGVGITFTPITRINSLLVVSSIPNIFEKVEGWLKELDKIPVEGTKYSVFVYYCQNAKAKDLADVLKQIYVTTKEKKGEFKEKVTEPLTYPKGVKPPPTPAVPPAPKEEGVGAVPEGEINIVVDETTNSLVIRAFARDFKSILETVKKLDIYPKQVLIEVFAAEITLDDSVKYGVEWAKFVTSTGPNAQSFVLGAQPPDNPFMAALPQAGFRYAVVELGTRLSAAINLAAAEDRLKVISSPHIIASNNKEAKIQVGSSQPILTSTYSYGSTSSTLTTTTPTTGTLEGTIEYKDIGIILVVTPRISDGGLVSLEISVEKSTVNASAVPLGNLSNVPVFGKKTAKTIVAVMEGQTIVIGGLIEESKEKISKGVPFLSKIPVLGGLFGTQEYDKKRTELIILMTPHIIADQIQSKGVTEEFKEKLESIKKELEKGKK
jgi:general secretion pathway protein D